MIIWRALEYTNALAHGMRHTFTYIYSRPYIYSDARCVVASEGRISSKTII